MSRSDTALSFARGINHDLSAFSDLFDGFFGFGGSPGRSGDHASVMARFAATTSAIAISSTLPELSVSTDKDDYAPGETATITASGFDEGATVTFEVDHVDGPGDDGLHDQQQRGRRRGANGHHCSHCGHDRHAHADSRRACGR